MKETLGSKISRLRREKGMTQEELGEKLGVSSQAVSKWENDVSCPDIMALPTLAAVLGVTVDALLSDGEPERVTMTENRDPADLDRLMLVIAVNSADGDTVRVNLPLPLIRVLIDGGISPSTLGGDRLNGVNIDWEQILSLIERGVIGKLVEVESADGDTVEVTVK